MTRLLQLMIPALVLCWAAPAVADTTSKAYARSYQLEARGKYTRALAALQRVDAAQQQRYFFRARLGWLRYLAGQHRGAVAAYRQASRLAPQAVEPLLGMMLPQMAARRWKDALAAGRAALRLAPGNEAAVTRLAWIYFNLGRHAEAEQTYRKVLRLYPANLTMRAGLGWALLRQGKKDQAAQAFRAALRVSPSHKSARAGLRALRVR